MGQKTNPNSLKVGNKKLWQTLFSEKKPRDIGNLSYIFESEILNYINRFSFKYGLYVQDYRLHYCEDTLKIFISVYSTTHLLIKKNGKNILLQKSKVLIVKSLKTKTSFLLTNSLDNKIQRRNFTEFLVKSISERLFGRKTKITVCYVNSSLNINFDDKGFIKKSLLSLRKFKNKRFFLENFMTTFLTTKNYKLSSVLLKVLMYYTKTNKEIKSLLNFFKKSFGLLIEHPRNNIKGLKVKIKGRLTKNSRTKVLKLIVGDVPCHSNDAFLDFSSASGQNQDGSYSVKLWIVSFTN